MFQTASFDGLGRRIMKVVTKSGDLDGTTVYYYRGHQIIETRDGSDNMVAQFIHGTQSLVSPDGYLRNSSRGIAV